MTVSKVTPIAVVDEIEGSLDFWERQLGFEKIAEVPAGGRLGFVMLKHGDAEIMLQSRASVEDDLGLLTAPIAGCPSVIYIEVSSLDTIIEKLTGCEVVVGERKTFYGSREIFYREPNGHIVGFAEPVSDD
jgi:uncharacterized glyoxalase superfamily protein PhnB